MSPPRVLTIAGSDSGGGAGIQADLKTFLSLGTYGLSVVTSLTAQSTTGVTAVHPSPPDFVAKQFTTVTSDIEIDAIKIGMLCDEHIVRAVADQLGQWQQQDGKLGGKKAPIVLDPVMVSTSGSLLLSETSIVTLIEKVLPLCTVLTPNLPEAKQLLKYASQLDSTDGELSNAVQASQQQGMDLAAMMQAAKHLSKLGPKAVLVKGGHAKFEPSEIEAQLQRLAAGADSQVVGQPEISSLVPSVEFLQRPVTGTKLWSSSTQDRLQQLRLLAGVEGAKVTIQQGIDIIRTDHQPFADILIVDNEKRPDRLSDSVVCDVLYESEPEGRFTLFIKPHLVSSATHGTGCTLSSAIAASLAQGQSVLASTWVGIHYVQRAISYGIEDLGQGSGPLDHSFAIQPRGLFTFNGTTGSRPVESNTKYPLSTRLISHSLDVWNSFVRHPFVQGLADGSLNRDAFVWFLKQDYLFLRHNARVWAQAATFCSNTFEEIATFAEMSQSMAKEAQLHVRLCQDKFGISCQELEHQITESAATLSYTRFVMEVGRSETLLELLIATAPCILGYGEVGLWLSQQINNDSQSDYKDKDYLEWIEGYSSKEFQDTVKKGMELIESVARKDPPSPVRMAQLQKIWNAACRLEIGMWDEAVTPQLRRMILEP